MTDQEDTFRAEARAWLAEHATKFAEPIERTDEELVAASLAWQKEKAAAGYANVPGTPEMGGRNGTTRMEAIFDEEEGRYYYPMFTGLGIGLGMAMPAIRKHGTPGQYERFGKPTYWGDAAWCQLFSEPAAGSDLAGLRTKAVRDGDNWIVNGQKVWSSWAHHADYAILLARTDPTVVKHAGITFFVLDMRTPGVEVRPIRQISGKSDFNETFLTDVVIPDANRIGAEGEGWSCAMTVLTHERNGSSGSLRQTDGGVRALIAKAAASGRLDSAAVRAKLAQWWVEEQGLRHFGGRINAALARGESPPVAMMKLASATKSQQMNAFHMDADEYDGLFLGDDKPEQEGVFFQYLWAAALRIAGGADEILRNQLAERTLGMPSEPRMDKVPFNQLPGVK